jgi:hypothetical protein
MAITGEIQGLYKDREHTHAIFPMTKVKAVTDDNGVGLNVVLDRLATKDHVSTEIAKAQLSGGSGTGNVDLDGFATKDDLASYVMDNALDSKTANLIANVDSVTHEYLTAAVGSQISDKANVDHTHPYVPVGMVTKKISVTSTSTSLEEQINTIYTSMPENTSEFVSVLSKTGNTSIGGGSNWQLLISKTNNNYGAIVAIQYGNPVVIKTRGLYAGTWRDWVPVVFSKDTVLTATNWSAYIDIPSGGTGTSAKEMGSEFVAYCGKDVGNGAIIAKPVNFYNYKTPGNASKLYNLTIRAIDKYGDDSAYGDNYFHSFTIGYKEIGDACSTWGTYCSFISAYNPHTNVVEHMRLTVMLNADKTLTFQFHGVPNGKPSGTTASWEFYQIRGLK